MAKYFYNIHGVSRSLDEEGEEHPNNDAAWNEATVIAGELFRNNGGKFRPGEEWALEVADDQRKPLYLIRISAQEMKQNASVGRVGDRSGDEGKKPSIGGR